MLLSAILLAACKQTKQDTVEDLISASAKFDKKEVGNLLTNNFVYSDKKERTLNKTEYLNQLDSLKNIEYKTEIISSQDLDSIVKTEESISTVFDSLMPGASKIIQKKTYRFFDKKIKSITVDTILNYDLYNKAFNEIISPILYYAKVFYDINDTNEIFKEIRKYINEYGKLSAKDKKKYKSYSKVQGTYIGKGAISKFEFKKEHCNFIYFGFSMNGKYSIDEDYVFIEASELGNISLKIIDNNTLYGEGFFAHGNFKRIK